MKAAASLSVSLAFALSACTCGNVPDFDGLMCDEGGVCPDGFTCASDNTCHANGGTGGGSAGGGGGQGGGAPDLCSGVVCDHPPASSCKDAQTLETFAGTCNSASGSCDYVASDTTCQQGCQNGQCVGNPCAGMTCTPPGPTCSGNDVITSSGGSCTNGTCMFNEMTMHCGDSGCANGACVGGGQTFTQVLPRVKHTINAIDQAPASNGTNVVVVGPSALSSWDGMKWTTVAATATTNFSSVWFSGSSSAFITTDRGLLKWNGSSASMVAGFPQVSASTGKLVDVHGRSETDAVVVDDIGTLYRLASGTWSTTTLTSFSGPYVINGVWIDSSVASGRIRAYGSCGGEACVAYSAAGILYDIEKDGSGIFTALGPSLTSGNYAWAGQADEVVTRNNPAGLTAAMKFDSTDTPVLPGEGDVRGIAPGGGGSVWVLTAPTNNSLGSLYRVTDPNDDPVVLANTFYGFQCLSKTESAGILFVDTDTKYGASTIVRRSATVEEALDLGESWVALAPTPNGAVFLNGAGDVALQTASPTFQLHRTLDAIDARDIAAGTAYAVFVGVSNSSATVQKVPLTPGSAYASVTIPNAPNSLNGICRVSDSEWYLVGESGSIYSFDGSTLHAMTSGSNHTLKDVDCPAAGVALACGDNGTVLRLQAGSWSALANAPSGNFTSCKLVGGVAYVAGNGNFAKFANGTWSTLGAMSPLTGLGIVSANEIYAASDTHVVRFNGNAWQTVATAPQTLNAGGLVGNHVVFAGNGGVVMEGQ